MNAKLAKHIPVFNDICLFCAVETHPYRVIPITCLYDKQKDTQFMTFL